jgi:hypothetical protein
MSEQRLVNWVLCFAYLALGAKGLGSGFGWQDPLMVFMGTIASGVGLFMFWWLQRYPERR